MGDLRPIKYSDTFIRRISCVSNTVLSLHTALPVLRSAPRGLPLPTDLLYTALFTTKKNTNFPNSRSALSLADLRWPTGFHFDCRLPRPSLKTYTATEQMHAAHIINVSYMFLGYFFPFNATVPLLFTYNLSEKS